MDLDNRMHRISVAWHEAGHATGGLAQGIHVTDLSLYWKEGEESPTGVRGKCSSQWTDTQRPQYLVMTACGERAQDRWFRENGLWNPQRGLAVEVEANDDRAFVLKIDPRYGFGDTELDYMDLLHAADRLLATVWPEVGIVAEELLVRGSLTGDEAAELCGIPNPPHPGGTA